MWRLSRKVFIVKWENFPSERKGWQGHDWVIEDKKLWKKLRFRRKVSLQDFPQFKSFAQEVVLPDWFEIKDDDDIKSLMEISFGFHDSIVTVINTVGNDTEVEFDTTWGCVVTVRFQGVKEVYLIDQTAQIFDAEITRTDSGFVWAVDCLDWSEDVHNTLEQPPYIVCVGIKWRVAIERSNNR